MHEFAAGVPALARGREHPAQRGALISGQTRLGGGEALALFECPIPAVTWDFKTFDELQDVSHQTRSSCVYN